jgi:hypothetical protein
MGILFDGVGMGGYSAVLDSYAEDTYGFVLGHQRFFDGTRRQLIFEFAVRLDQRSSSELGLSTSLQQALGRRVIARVDGFVHARMSQRTRVGGRAELLIKF